LLTIAAIKTDLNSVFLFIVKFDLEPIDPVYLFIIGSSTLTRLRQCCRKPSDDATFNFRARLAPFYLSVMVSIDLAKQYIN